MSWFEAVQNLHWIRPEWLLALIPLPFVVWKLLQRSARGGAWSHEVDAHLLPHLLEGQSQGRRFGGPLLVALSWMITVIALAGPAWDKLERPVFQRDSARVILFDLSRSMDSTDVTPSRLERAKHKVLDLIDANSEGQTGMIVFAGGAWTLSPMTEDAKTIAAQIPHLQTTLVPAQGGRLDLALDAAQAMLERSRQPRGTVWLITDSAPDVAATKAAERLRAAGHRLSVLAIGTADGSPIPTASGGFVKDASGAIVLSKVDRSALASLAQSGGGSYTSLSVDDSDIDQMAGELSSGLREMDAEEQEGQESEAWQDRGPYLVLLLLPLAALVFRRGLLAVLLCFAVLVPPPASAGWWEDLWQRQDQQAAEVMAQQEYNQAAEIFDDTQWRAAAQYRAADYRAAAETLESAEGVTSKYNRGNALAMLGELEKAIEQYDEVLQADPEHADAKQNRELVQRLLEQQEQQQDQSSDGEQSDAQDGEQQGSESDQQDGEQGQESQQSGEQQSEQSAQQEAAEGDEQSAEQQAAEQAREEAEEREAEQSAQAEQSEEEAAEEAEAEAIEAPVASWESGEASDEQAIDQWLRRIPDDPGRLWREKFFRQQQRQGGVIQDDEQAW